MKTDSLSERELATRCAAKDREAQGVLYTRYASMLYALCFRYVGDREEAQDLMHDSMIKAMDSIGTFRYNGEGSLNAWLRRLTVNVSIDRLREMSKLRLIPLDQTTEPDTLKADEDDDAVDTIPAQVMMDMVVGLPSVKRAVFNMYCIDGFSHKEIARALGITERGSTSIMAKARASVKSALISYLNKTGQ